MPAMSSTKPGYLRYLARPEHLEADRWTIVKAGRFLRRHCPQLSDEDVKQLTADIVGSCSEYTLMFTEAGDCDKIADVYRHGPNSCQSGYKPYNHGDISVDGEFYAPVRIYGHPDSNLRLAYLVNAEGQYAARAWVNVERKLHNVVYASTDTFKGSDSVMLEFLKEAGYTEDGEECMYGEPLLRVETDCGAIVCPYIDPGNLGVEVREDYLVIGGAHEANYETGCLRDYDLQGHGYCCDRCYENVHEDRLRYVEDTEESVCDDCLEVDFVWAEVGGYHGHDWVHHENAEELVDGDVVHYRHLRTGDFVQLDWGDSCGRYCRIDDAVHCEERGWCLVAEVQEQGLSMCHECSTLMIPVDDACSNCGYEDYYKV